MSYRELTKEPSHFLVHFNIDNTHHVSPRHKIDFDGRVKIGNTYSVIWGRTNEEIDQADVIGSGTWLEMRKLLAD